MPDTIQTFSGSHESGNKECEECHTDNTNTGDVMPSLSCIDCHNENDGSHIIDLPACKSESCHPGLQVLYNASDPHNNLAVNASESNTLHFENEACFLCHANINVRFNFIRPQYIEFDIFNWTLQNLTVGPDVSNQISIQRDGISHLWISGSEIQCIQCHTDITANLSAHYPSSDSAHPTTGVQCPNCHQKSSFQHTARYVLCIECHNQSYINSEHQGLFDQISEQPTQYQGNICIGCHNDNNVSGSSASHFKVYLESVYNVN